MIQSKYFLPVLISFRLYLILLSVLLAFLGHLGNQNGVQARAEQIKVALVLDKGGKDDKSFNASAFSGVELAKKELNIEFKYVEAVDDAAIEATVRSFASKGFSPVVCIGFAMADAVKKIAPQFPKTKFVLVDAEAKGSNIRSVLFEEQHGSFLVGALAAMETKKKIIGFVGGMDVPLIRRFQMGFEAGAKKINPEIKVLTNYIGVTSDSWSNPAKAKELALRQYQEGADIIFGAAGASNYGIFDAASSKKLYAIGVDSNQNWVKPGFIITSMLKRIDLAVFSAIKDYSQGNFSSGLVRLGLADKGVDYVIDQYNEKLISSPTRSKLEEIRSGIISKKIEVPDYYLHGKK